MKFDSHHTVAFLLTLGLLPAGCPAGDDGETGGGSSSGSPKRP
jgi:hypothetical protein